MRQNSLQKPGSLGVPDPSCSSPPPNTSEFSLDLKTALAPIAELDPNALLKITEKWGKEPVPAPGVSKPASPLAVAKRRFTRGHPALKFDFYVYVGETIDSFVLPFLPRTSRLATFTCRHLTFSLVLQPGYLTP